MQVGTSWRQFIQRLYKSPGKRFFPEVSIHTLSLLEQTPYLHQTVGEFVIEHSSALLAVSQTVTGTSRVARYRQVGLIPL